MPPRVKNYTFFMLTRKLYVYKLKMQEIFYNLTKPLNDFNDLDNHNFAFNILYISFTYHNIVNI